MDVCKGWDQCALFQIRPPWQANEQYYALIYIYKQIYRVLHAITKFVVCCLSADCPAQQQKTAVTQARDQVF